MFAEYNAQYELWLNTAVFESNFNIIGSIVRCDFAENDNFHVFPIEDSSSQQVWNVYHTSDYLWLHNDNMINNRTVHIT